MFRDLETLPADPLFGLLSEFERDPNPDKLNLGLGVFVTEAGEPYVMPAVRQAMSELPHENNNYTPISGDPRFLRRAAEMVLGRAHDEERLALQAVCGGTHACSLFAALARRAGYADMLVPEPTWVNHRNIFSNFFKTAFPHVDDVGQVDAGAYRRHIEAVVKPTVLLLHGGPTHNPTGVNLTLDQIRSLTDAIRSRPILVFIDFAYLGLGDGINEDAAFTRLLLDELDEVAVGVSFSKNATLYRHRTGVLMVKTKNKETVESNLRQLMRASISTAPAFGQMTLNAVFDRHEPSWLRNIDEMRRSIDRRRGALVAMAPSHAYLRSTRGLFGLLKISPKEIERLRREFSIYIPDGGRINFSGIRLDRIDHLIEALNTVKGSRI